MPVAARLERQRLVRIPTGSPGSSGEKAQRTTQKNAGFRSTGKAVCAMRCVDRLNPDLVVRMPACPRAGKPAMQWHSAVSIARNALTVAMLAVTLSGCQGGEGGDEATETSVVAEQEITDDADAENPESSAHAAKSSEEESDSKA